MSNCTIVFEAKNDLVSGVTAEDEITLDVTLTAFDLSTSTEKKVNKTMSGRQTSTKFYNEDSYRMTFTDSGLVTLQDTTTTSLTTEYVEMFLRSTDNSETFTITSLDDNDVAIDVKQSGSWSRSRKSAAFVNKFDYSLTVRKVI